MLSKDEGETWTWPRVLLDSAGDDRDSGVLETAEGTLVVTTFTSNAYQQHLKEGTLFHIHTENSWISRSHSPEELAQWRAADQRLSESESKAELGEWCIRSTDGGISWSARIPTIVNSPHGPIQLRDGRLLYAGKQLYAESRRVGVCESKNDGLSWGWLAEIPLRKGDTQRYHELHAVEAANGTLIAHIRNHNDENKGWTLQSESTDGGVHWNEPHPVCYGFPSHLLCLRDGRLLMSYGYRRAPYGNRARVSADNGKTWGEEIVLSADGADGDLGYTSTVELSDGTLLSVWYESQGDKHLAVLRQARWRLG
ncbi:MAG: BNR repeat-like domain-containing protein [Verrucomicrobia bacterium]|nr:MAG: BNR repeat-like domain-containing protein [Verrucomicrobiota bacterium]